MRVNDKSRLSLLCSELYLPAVRQACTLYLFLPPYKLLKIFFFFFFYLSTRYRRIMSYISVGVCVAEGLLDLFPGSAQGFAIWMVSYRRIGEKILAGKTGSNGDLLELF